VGAPPCERLPSLHRDFGRMTPHAVLGRQKATACRLLGRIVVARLPVSHNSRGYRCHPLWWARPSGWPRVPRAYPYGVIIAPTTQHDWLGLTDGVLPVAVAADWAVLPNCGAVVLFSGTARDHAPGRDGVEQLEYEAYEEQVVARLAEIATRMRETWPTLGRVVLLHRIGIVPIGESSVVVVASSPHRPEAFEAARFGIDTLKATVPIWKRERWSDGESWGLDAQPIGRLSDGS
jgi:molybdopterin synthase catalytic subunit